MKINRRRISNFGDLKSLKKSRKKLNKNQQTTVFFLKRTMSLKTKVEREKS